MTSTSDRRKPPAGAAADLEAKLRALRSLPLFSGLSDDDIAGVARATRVVQVPEGDDVWREGDEADGLYVVVSGRVTVETRLPAQREVEIATLGVGGVLGEIPLLGGGRRWATVRTLEESRFVVLGRLEFGALVSGASPGALVVRRRLLALVCARLRERHEALADWLGGGSPSVGEQPVAAPRRRHSVSPPREDYVLRLPFFRDLDRASADEIVRRGRIVDFPSSRFIAAEGAPAGGCWITLNGAVEELIRRGDHVIRVSLAGPGHAFGYLGLIDGGADTVAAATRERSRLLFLPPEEFENLFDPAALAATGFREAIQRDLVRALRSSWRPQARLAVWR